MSERSLYRRTCDRCGKTMVNMYPPDKKLTVYCNACWWGDGWDGLEYGQKYDPSRPFLAQLQELQLRVPQLGLAVNQPTLVNSDYINHAATSKNCYLIYTADYCENVLYSELLLRNKDSMDATMLGGSELCYGLVNCGQCYRTFFSEDCESCQNVYFSKDLNGCSNCFGCANLRNKNYYIFNEPYSKEDYQKKLEELGVHSWRNLEAAKIQARELWLRYPRKFAHALRNLNTTGDYVYESKNSKDMYIVHQGAEDCRYCQIITMPPLKDCYDYTIWGNSCQRIYECMVVGEGADTIKFSHQAWPNVLDIEYCIQTMSSSHMFGCVGVRKKEHCILNTQYSKEEYAELKARIIRDMDTYPFMSTTGAVYRYGEFLPPDLSLFGYNESYACDFFPLTKDEALQKGLSWYDAPAPAHAPTLPATELPDSIRETPDDILREIIECSGCKKPFRLIPAELDLLRRFDLPLPRSCPNCRYEERLRRIGPPRLLTRRCDCKGGQSVRGGYVNQGDHAHGQGACANEFATSYPLEAPDIIYCEACYQAEIS